METQVLFVPDLARMLNMTEAAIRGHYYRRSGAIPKAFKMGKKIAWRRESVLEFLKQREARAK